MIDVQVLHYDAFATEPQRGNPAGVVLDGTGLSDAAMQDVAATMGFNETAFVLPPTTADADLRLRFWTPGHEANLCGHATVATMWALHERGMLPPRPADAWRVETNVGVLPIALRRGPDGAARIRMAQAPARFAPFEGDHAALASVLGISPDDLRDDLQVVYGNTGLWTLVVPVVGLAAMRRMQPHTARFPDVLRAMPRASVHPFCTATIDPTATLHARHFSSPFSGTVEDPVTGTASGVLGAYLLRYVHPDRDALSLVVEQGQETGRDGRVAVEVRRRADDIDVWIEGTAVAVGERTVTVGG